MIILQKHLYNITSPTSMVFNTYDLPAVQEKINISIIPAEWRNRCPNAHLVSHIFDDFPRCECILPMSMIPQTIFEINDGTVDMDRLRFVDGVARNNRLPASLLSQSSAIATTNGNQ